MINISADWGSLNRLCLPRGRYSLSRLVRMLRIAPVLGQLCWVNGGRRLISQLVVDETIKRLSRHEGKIIKQLTRCGLFARINCWMRMDDLATGWLAYAQMMEKEALVSARPELRVAKPMAPIAPMPSLS